MRGLCGIQWAHTFQRASLSNSKRPRIHCMLGWSKNMMLPGVILYGFSAYSRANHTQGRPTLPELMSPILILGHTVFFVISFLKPVPLCLKFWKHTVLSTLSMDWTNFQILFVKSLTAHLSHWPTCFEIQNTELDSKCSHNQKEAILTVIYLREVSSEQSSVLSVYTIKQRVWGWHFSY